MRKYTIKEMNQRFSEPCQQIEEIKCVKYSALQKSDTNNDNNINETRPIPYLTSNIHPSNCINPEYLELDTIQSDIKSSKPSKGHEIDINPNYLSHMVYKCSMDPSQLIYHKYNETNQLTYNYPIEPCEYMSCDLSSTQQQAHVTLIHHHPEMNIGMNNLSNLTSSELIKLFTDTTGEDFITSV
ncbi:hypothetical protein Smp_170780 [Schistosoma mansoni]|nr:hypothetical protein Smp_170780 [Schistosoma mansoni]|eukprot:XP_018648318.1 hypothetical protein Smp_170780 [Schistosoma mansoni]